MTLDDWLLALHLLSAFALVGATVMFAIVVVALRSSGRPTHVLALAPLFKAAGIVVVVGSLGTVVFGVWLAISLDAYHVWDGWVIAAIVLWAIGSETGRRGDPEYRPAFSRAEELVRAGDDSPSEELAALCRPRLGLVFNAVASAAVLLILIDMVWKPGA